MNKKKNLSTEQMNESKALKRIYLDKKDILGINQQDLADAITAGQAAVSHYMNGVNALNLKVASAFAQILQVPISSFSPRLAEEMKLISSKDHVYEIANKKETDAFYTPNEILNIISKKLKYPLINFAIAGEWRESMESYNTNDVKEWPSTTKMVDKNSFWLRVKGNSMTAPSGLSIPEGMLILVDPSIKPKSNKLVIAKLKNDSEATFKQYVEDAGKKFLVSLNPSWPIIEIDDSCTIIGVVVEAKIEL
ncbi:helix-turn-helix domain-containing protein [Gilliamella sp. B3486]|uniref:LexA family transcriptional regulator n=1 Tax=unclassified Gilliamella TaxID=2685620 RepID=UPI00226ADD3D|nr:MULTISPECIES: LexA family transcriptional regulator [unclassified Gilliamella]MCX8596773.1 helix-turn-helix domain-containing protein [Gilliamella sp. B3493]MCX8598501.1 helix-turn-helix domain-containing protein [Gilliamella sp. B3486]MCX8704488.1 helix-turn-helix domain-containing protein [Gilliamella sp. B3127]